MARSDGTDFLCVRGLQESTYPVPGCGTGRCLGASPVMAAFTHIGMKSRFTDGTYGVYYVANSLQTAVEETKYHRAKFLASTDEDDQEITMRIYFGKITERLRDLRTKPFKRFFDPTDYRLSQELGAELREARHWGVLYPSVRDEGGRCVAVFSPRAVAKPRQGSHLRYVYQKKSQSITQVLRVRGL